MHNISLCYRCDTPVEPLVSKQWFIAVDKKFGKAKKSLKQLSLDVVKNGKIEILPRRFEKTYFHWMENLHDWCISRQIWFGHQIPVWYCVGNEKEGGACKLECKKPFVQVEAPKKCPHCGSKNLQQDPDTLDTWFSSGLWTFSTLGWPKKTKDLEYFHPTSVLETGYDILFFWIARMILMTTYALDEIPFKYVYLHGLVRTREGKKMSKSDPATCIDPLDMIAKYGADALRLSMVIGATPGNDIRLYEEKIAGFRNFVNKIWNATRFALLAQNELLIKKRAISNRALSIKKPHQIKPRTLADKWILTRTQQIIKEVTDDIEQFRFSDAGMKIYDFTWGEYCAWYLEIAKGESQNLGVLNYVLETILALLHPFVPYVTETLWEKLGKKNLLISHSWPTVQKKFIFPKETAAMSVVINTVTAIRNLRHESKIEPAKKIHAIFVSKKWQKLLEEKREPIMRLAKLGELEILSQAPHVHPALTHYTDDGVEIFIPLAGLIDIDAEQKRLTNEKEQLEQYAASLQTKLANEHFTSRAPKEIVETERVKLKTAKGKLSAITLQIKNLEK
ncbi:class I tRNA ligase family protein [Candidatus Peregrinibacteria bacterium]|nr:class I tRNA ligase family protein [Candidatus Peregrinibacteria bacterium]